MDTLGALPRSPLLSWYGHLPAVEMLAANGSPGVLLLLTGLTLSVNI